jgi:superfamily II DNA or RNA helicase
LFLTLPVSWRGTIAQYVGRLHRLLDGKREVQVYDYADLNVPMLARMFDRRCRGYEAVGYRRDRRKDQLLQENGYLVLRYLAEDLAKELDSLLDGILRSLSSRRKSGTVSIPITIARQGCVS